MDNATSRILAHTKVPAYDDMKPGRGSAQLLHPGFRKQGHPHKHFLFFLSHQRSVSSESGSHIGITDTFLSATPCYLMHHLRNGNVTFSSFHLRVATALSALQCSYGQPEDHVRAQPLHSPVSPFVLVMLRRTGPETSGGSEEKQETRARQLRRRIPLLHNPLDSMVGSAIDSRIGDNKHKSPAFGLFC